jgi:hypothetical protein
MLCVLDNGGHICCEGVWEVFEIGPYVGAAADEFHLERSHESFCIGGVVQKVTHILLSPTT